MTESTSTVIKMIDNENNEKEYFLSLSKWGGHAELFDFENDESYVKTLENFTVLSNIKSIKHTFVPLNSENKYLFGFISFHNAENRTYLQKHKFNYLNQFETDISYTNESINEFGTYGYEISCYQAISGCIYCFSLNDVDSELYYYAYKYESDFSNSLNFSIKSSINDEYTFCKCIHLKEEIGVYAYYSNNTGNFNPTILFRQFNVDENKFENFLSSEYVSSEIMITKFSFLNNLLLNDIIKITDNKIAFLATLEDKETLYIIIFNIYGNGDIKVKIRYFSIQLYALYHYKILFDLKLIRYKNILGLGMSFCPDQNCTSDYNEHYSGLILFSYPNSSDTELYLDKFIFDNNINFSNIEIDLTKQLIIENNLFGYILSNIVINNIVNCGDYKLYSSKDESIEIIDYSYLEEDTKIKIKYTGIQNIYPTLNCNIQYFFNAKEPELEIYNDFAEDHEGENEDDLFIRQDYPGRLSYYKIILNKELTTSCDNNNCDLCLNGQNSYCLTCKYNFDLNNETGEIRKICYDQFTENITVITDSDSTNNDNDNINFCTNEEIINNKCVEKYVSENQFKGLYNKIKDYYIKTNYNGNNTIIQTKNIIFQVSKLEEQLNSDNPDISSIDLGKCEERLKFHYDIIDESLIIYKIDVKTPDLTQTYVQYEIYNPKNFTLLDLSICNDLKITVNTPVILDNITSTLYDSLKESGYDLFNQNDSFYNDICSTYTTENDTDITLNDRKQIIYNNYANISLCQSGCQLDSYNSTSKKANCQCSPQMNETDENLNINKIIDNFSFEMITDSFISTIKNSNFLVLKCYKLAFDYKDILKNIGRIIMTIIILISSVFFIVFCICDFKKIDGFLKGIYKIKLKYINKQNNDKINNKKLNDESNESVNISKISKSKKFYTFRFINM